MNKLKIAFLGGVGEIGKNMTALCYEDDIIIIDSGSAFPGDDLPGIDLVIPDITFLNDNRDKIRGIFITHGHEDHIGSLPYLLRQINVPVYASALTFALLAHKFEEHRLGNLNLTTVKPRSVVRAGAFSVEFLKVSHSVAGAFALSITTPIGVVFHTGDFKVDYNPIDGERIDLHRMAEIGKKGTLLLMAESTNVERSGYTMSESTVGKSLTNIFNDNADRRIFIATFASNIHRLQQIADLAEKFSRKLAFSGRSMLNVTEAAANIGELKLNRANLIDIEKVEKLGNNKVVILTTGAQGEPMSALSRMASGDFNKINIGENDTIIISASPIPGNEKMVSNVINNLYRKGAKVIYESLAEVHVSGHACREELKLIHTLLRPKFFVPVHGEYRHLKQHCELAAGLGIPERNMLISDIGTMIEVDRHMIKKSGFVVAGNIFVDGSGIGDVGTEVLRDRKHLSEDGIIVVVITVNAQSGEVIGPEVISRGFVYVKESEELIEACKQIVLESVSRFDLKTESDRGLIKNTVRKDMRNFLFKRTKRSPMILPIVIET